MHRINSVNCVAVECRAKITTSCAMLGLVHVLRHNVCLKLQFAFRKIIVQYFQRFEVLHYENYA
jgi:hypothetical protein